MAGSLVVPDSINDPPRYYSNSVAASTALLRTAVAAGVAHVVFSSTAAIYGAPPVSPVDDSVRPAPINPYGRSKLAVEWVLADLAAAAPVNFAALRDFNVVGVDP